MSEAQSDCLNCTQIKFTTLCEHRQFTNEIETELVSICQQDPLLNQLVPMLSVCNETNYNHLVTEHLNSLVDNHYGRTFELKIQFLDGNSYSTFVPHDSNISELRRSIERSLSIRAEINAREEQRKVKMYKRIDWTRIWNKYDLWIDREQRISLKQKSSTQDGILGLNCKINESIIKNHSVIEFIHRRT